MEGFSRKETDWISEGFNEDFRKQSGIKKDSLDYEADFILEELDEQEALERNELRKMSEEVYPTEKKSRSGIPRKNSSIIEFLQERANKEKQ